MLTETIMSIAQQALQYGKRRVTKKLVRAVPILGAAVAAATLIGTMRRKGMFRGAVDMVLDFIPFVGGAKNAVEIVRGRDFLPDRPRS